MELQNKKCVMVIDESLPHGVAANAAGILGITLGKHFPAAVGPDVVDQNGNAHLGITALPVPILKADQQTIRAIRTQLYQPEFSDLLAVDFSDVAQGCRTYDEFIEKARSTAEEQLCYLAIGLCGAKKAVNKLTGSLPLL